MARTGRPTAAAANAAAAERHGQQQMMMNFFSADVNRRPNASQGDPPPPSSEPSEEVIDHLLRVDTADHEPGEEPFLTPSGTDDDDSDDERDDQDATSTRFNEYFKELTAIIQQRASPDVQKEHPWLVDLMRYGHVTVPKPQNRILQELHEKGWTSPITPQDIYLPDVVIWFPTLAMKENVSCLKEGCSGNLRLKGAFTKPPARRIIGMSESIFLMGWRLKCNECNSTCGTTNIEYIRRLPYRIRRHFKYHLTHRSGITSEVASMTRDLFPSGHGPSRMAENLRAKHMQRHAELEATLLSMAIEQRQQSPPRVCPPLRISAFKDKEGYNGYVPSGTYLGRVFTELMEDVLKDVEKLMSLMPIEIAKADHSFKVGSHLIFWHKRGLGH